MKIFIITMLICFMSSVAISQDITLYDIQTLNPRVSDSKASELSEYFNLVGHISNIEPKILASIAFQESSFRHTIISGNDIGLFQLNYYWQIARRNEIQIYNIEQLNEDWKLNTDLAIRHLVECRERHLKTSKFPWWVCFHSPTYKYQKIYHSRIIKHLEKIK